MRKVRKFSQAIMAALLGVAAVIPSTVAALESADRDQLLKKMAKAEPGLAEDALAIWRFAEMGYQEQKSSAQLAKRLRGHGFAVTQGVAGIPTAFTATFKNGEGPVIGLIAEFDALPGLSQDTIPTPQPIAGQAAGHGCGHNLFGAASVAAAIALKDWMQANGIKGEVRIFGAPAEEGGSGKVYMVRAGLFNDVDTVLHFHPDDHNTASQPQTLAVISGKFRFRGVSAHAAGHPEEGVSALDAVQVMNFAVEQIREHVPDGSRIHYVITDGGKAPNVVPDTAESYYYVRHADPAVAGAIWDRVKKAAEGAAIATGAKWAVEVTGGTYPLLPNRTLMSVMDESIRSAPMVPWSAEDRSFAEKIAATIQRKESLDQNRIRPAEFGKILFGSTDVGDVSWTVPTAGMEIMTWVPGTAGHSWQATAASGNGVGIKGATLAARTLALAAAHLFRNPSAVAQAKAEFDAARGKSFVYRPLIGDRAPALDYRSKENGTD